MVNLEIDGYNTNIIIKIINSLLYSLNCNYFYNLFIDGDSIYNTKYAVI